MTPWKQTYIDQEIEKIHQIFEQEGPANTQALRSIEANTEEEFYYLNHRLNLSFLAKSKPEFILHTLLKQADKRPLAFFLLRNLAIDLDVSQTDGAGNTVFSLLVDGLIASIAYSARGMNTPSFTEHILALYQRGYVNTEADAKFITEFYKHKISSQKVFEHWCLARVCYKLNNLEKIERALGESRVIFCLLSFKQQKPIGYGYNNLLALANYAIKYCREYGDLLLYAMKYYGVYEDIKDRDRKGSFANLEAEYYKFKPVQNSHFVELAYEIFPELKPSKPL